MSWLSLHFVHACLMLLLKAIDLQINVVRELHGNSLWTRTLEGTNNASADTVLKVFQNISYVTSLSGILDHRQSCLYTLITALIAAAVVRCNTSRAAGIFIYF